MAASESVSVPGALLLANALFGAGSVVGSIGLPSMNPLVFASLREASATLILGCVALVVERRDATRKPQDAPPPVAPRRYLYASLGVCVFLDQGCSIAGIKLSDAVTQSIWQTTQPVITAALSRVVFGEPLTWRRSCGVACAFAGCVAMVGLGARSSAAPASRFRYVAANGLFLVNCTASSAYVILSKGAAPDAPTVSVTFRTYLRAAALMVLTTTVVNASGPLLAVVCDDCGRRGAWRVPARALWALAYWVLGQSVVAYCLVTWATRRASSTLVSAFAVVQPVVAAALTAAILAAGAYANCATSADDDACLAPTGWPALGAVPIFAGLFLVVRTEAPPAPPAPLAHPLLLATDDGVQ